MIIKRKKLYKRVKFNRYFAPFITFLFFLCLYFVVNFQVISYEMNNDYYKKLKGVVVEETVDGLTNIIPTNKVEYTFNNNKYDYDMYNIYGFRKGDKLDVLVNVKAPNFIFILEPNYIMKYNYIFYIIFGICFIVHIRLLVYGFKYKRQRKEIKRNAKKKKKEQK